MISFNNTRNHVKEKEARVSSAPIAKMQIHKLLSHIGDISLVNYHRLH